MIRLFVASDFDLNKKVELPVKQAHYVLHVMRIKAGDSLEIINGRQGLWLAEVSIEKKRVYLNLLKQVSEQKKLPRLILCPALIKKEAMDLVIQKATELGATEIYPVLAEHSVVHTLNTERLENIIQESCEQCERLDKPQLNTPEKLEKILEKLNNQAQIIWLSERGKSAGKREKRPAALFVGPEGGWSPKEQALFKQFQAVEWHLGQTILRAETASIAALALCLPEN